MHLHIRLYFGRLQTERALTMAKEFTITIWNNSRRCYVLNVYRIRSEHTREQHTVAAAAAADAFSGKKQHQKKQTKNSTTCSATDICLVPAFKLVLYDHLPLFLCCWKPFSLEMKWDAVRCNDECSCGRDVMTELCWIERCFHRQQHL